MSSTRNASSQHPKNKTSLNYVRDFLAMKKQMSRMQEFLIKTECEESQFCEETGLALHLKKDFRQITGSCHARSALCTLLNLSNEHKQNGVITALEEDALPLCYFGEKLNIPVTIVLPNTTLLNKIYALEQYQYTNTTLFIEGNNSDEAEKIASDLAKMNNMYCIKRDDRARFIGYGTIAIEIAEQVPNLDIVVVPYDEPIFTSIVSVMKVLKPSVKVIIAADKSINSMSISSSKFFQSIQLSPSTLPTPNSASNQVISTSSTPSAVSDMYMSPFLSRSIFTLIQTVHTLSSAIKSILSSVSTKMLSSSTKPISSSASIEKSSSSIRPTLSSASVKKLSCLSGPTPSSASVKTLSSSTGPTPSYASVEILSRSTGPTPSSVSVEILSCSTGPTPSSASIEILSCSSGPTLSSASIEILSCSSGPIPSSVPIETLSSSTEPTPSSASVEILSCSSGPTPSSASVEILAYLSGSTLSSSSIETVSSSNGPILSSASDQISLPSTKRKSIKISPSSSSKTTSCGPTQTLSFLKNSTSPQTSSSLPKSQKEKPLVNKDMDITVVVLTDEEIDTSILKLFKKERCIVNRVGVMSLAACLKADGPSFEAYKNKRVVSLLTSCNDDILVLPTILERALLKEHQLAKVSAEVPQDELHPTTELANALTNNVSMKKMAICCNIAIFCIITICLIAIYSNNNW
ncbi:uncharacterized protein [Linepithema humile]|uniref:uncharacterized protein isoform X1 n=1 Tax=Linepithema humile TaxID=83485 RepID=UPI00351F6FE0